jgi:hypothetical protein
MREKTTKRKMLPLWKKEQLREKKKRLIALGYFSLALLLGISGIRLQRKFFKILTTPLDQNCWVQKTNSKNINRINIVLESEAIVLASLDQSDQTVSFLEVPEDLCLKLDESDEFNQLGKAFELGEENFGCGGRVLATTMQELLGLPIDGYIKIINLGFYLQSREDARLFVDRLQSLGWALKPRATLDLLKSLKTNFSFWEIGKFWWQLRKIRFNKIFFWDLKNDKVFTEAVPVSGGQGRMADQILLDEMVKEYFFDSKVKFEALAVEVLNGTDRAGLGKRVGRFITNLGADLVNVGNFDRKIKKTKIFVIKRQLKDSYTVVRLANFFDAEVEIKEWEQARGDLAVVIGADYSNKP